ncbi:MAG TPA: ABC transporter permease [Chryseolinea sp.]|nr:ABC transporter permease [Chryseolinea sp.]
MTRLHSRLFVRTLSRNGDVYLLKFVTLALAFATSILVILFSMHEFGYDTNYEDADHVFRMLARNTDKDYPGNRLSASIPKSVLKSVNNKFSDSIIVSRVKALNKVTVLSQSNQPVYDQIIYAADTTIDNIFSFEVADGSIHNFTQSHGAVAMLSSSTASQYFGDKPPVGKTIRLTTFGDTLSVVVVAVFHDFPSNTHEDFDFFIRYDSSTIAALNFDPEQSSVYARLLSGKITRPSLSGVKNGHTEFLLQPIKEIYFGPRAIYEEARHGDMYSMVILICIVSLIFLLALCSFVNLSTITLPYRSKEIAVKKLAGITQRQLLVQFIYESLTLTSLSLFLGVTILIGASHYLGTMLGIDIIHMLVNTSAVFFGVIVVMVSGVVISPVFMVIRFIRATPTRLLSTDTITFPRFKRIITIVQFGVSIFLIVSSIVVRRQINYSLLKESGRNHDQVVYMACPVNISDSAIHKIRAGWPDKNPKLLDAMAISQLPGQLKSKDAGSDLFVLQVDWNFLDFFQFAMQDGRWFKPTDYDSATVVNQMALRKMPKLRPNVIGVIHDLSSSFNQPEQPVKIRLAQNSSYNWLCVRVLEVDIRRTVQWIEQRMHAKGSRGSAHFLNPHFESWLTYQDHLNALSGILTVISALLAGCAIYGLTVSLVRDKLKEIAVHHLFGARTSDVTRLLALGLLRQMFLALAFFGPLTFLLLTELLKTFAYSTKFSWTDPVYPVGYCLVVIIGLCAYQAFSLNRRDFASALKGRS